jgi:hypothetical protein
MKNVFKIPKLNLIRSLRPYKVLAAALLLPLVGGWGASCSLFPEPEPTLPPITQNGAETFGCLVNGKVFVPKGGGSYAGITKNYDGRLAIFALHTDKNNLVDASMGILTPIIDKVGIYTFEVPNGLWYTASWNWYGTENKPIESKLIITKFERGEDKTQNTKWLTISGTFEGVLLPEKNSKDTLYVTQGRFDVKFN